MNAGSAVALAALGAAALLCIGRIVRPGSTLVDRAVGLDLLLVTIVAGIAVLAARTGSGVFLDLLVITGLLGFVSTVVTARFVESRRRAR
ncbi:MAG: monovalent cation/H+ antiporter complex subunit F [Acidimicrobiales bacterium]